MTRKRGVAIAAATVILAVVAIAVGKPPSSATIPGPHGVISFARWVPKTANFEIFTAWPDGSEVRRLTSNPRRFDMSDAPDWSPDGQKIAFESGRVDIDGREDVDQIYVMSADGGGVTQLTRGPGFQSTPGWSPDGGSLAIAAAWGQRTDPSIWIIPASDPNGVTQAEAVRLTTQPKGINFDYEPQFSPDGSSIVFTRVKYKSAGAAIHRVNIDGTGLQRLTPWKLNASAPDWSPDGQMITFDSGGIGQLSHPAKSDIYVMAADGSGRTRLTDNRRIRTDKPFKFAQHPVWSPSGTKIMYTRLQGRGFAPWVFRRPLGGRLIAINPDGSGEQVVVNGKQIQNNVDWGTHP